MHKTCLEVAVGTCAAGEILYRWRFGLWITVHHGTDAELLEVGVAHLGRWPVRVEVHHRANGHKSFITIQLEVFIGFYWGVVCEEI